MTYVAILWLSLLLVRPSVLGFYPDAQAQSPDAASLQQMLDRDDYIGCYKALGQVDPTRFTEAQRAYFFGMVAFHLGHLEDNADPVPMLDKAIRSKDKSLTAHQIESALETIGQIHLKLGNFGASAQDYDDIDKIFGAQLGDGEKSIRESRHLAALLQHVPRQTVEISDDFTIPRMGVEYPVSVPNSPSSKPLFAQFDSGAELSVLSATTAKAWGVTMLDGVATLHGYTGGGFPAQPGYLPVLRIGKAELRNVAVYVTADENLYIAQAKLQTNALLGYPVVAALGRLTFAKGGSLTVSAKSPARDLHTSAALWMSDHTLLVELGTQPVILNGKLTGVVGERLFMLDTGSGSTWLTDHFLAEHRDLFHGVPGEMARLAGAGGIREIPAYGAQNLPLLAGGTVLFLNGPHILTQPTSGEAEQFFGVIGRDTLGVFSSYTVDFRNMTLTVQR
jgi:CBS domain-containing protein